MTFSRPYAPILKFRNILTVILLFLFSATHVNALAQDAIDVTQWETGKKMFKSNCQSCHLPDKKMTGPAVAGALERWEEAGDYQGKTGKEWLHEWIKNWETPVKAGMPYAVEMAKFDGSVMQLNPTLSDADIDAILYYADNSTYSPNKPAGGGGDLAPEATSSFPMETFLWILIGGLVLVSLILWRVFSTLRRIAAEKKGEVLPDPIPLWKNKKIITLLVIAGLVFLAYTTASNAIAIGRQQNYQPTQPIKYSHELHAGKYKIECQYCHTGAGEGKHSNIPSINVCMNCHKNIQQGPKHGRKEIAKIYAAIGYNPVEGSYFKENTPIDDVKAALVSYLKEDYAETSVNQSDLDESLETALAMYNKPVEWVRIHNLPDHVYFNHAQHVTAGKVECQTCHGDIQKMEVVAQHAPLSMGWCINCHRETEVDMGNNYYQVYEKYHEDLKSGAMDKVTVEDIGGTECQKCHY